MLRADEARKKANEILERGLTQECEKVESLIKDAINEGKLQVYIDGRLRPETKRHFEMLGYDIEEGGRYNEIDTVIKW